MKDRNDREPYSEAQLIDVDSHKNVRNLHVFKKRKTKTKTVLLHALNMQFFYVPLSFFSFADVK